MKIGLSLSPGGLLLPYHMGVLHQLKHENVIDSSTLVAGSSAGSIAAMAHGCDVHPYQVLEGTIEISETCQKKYGRAHGKLLQQLEHHMERLVGQKEFDHLQQQSSKIGIAYTQVFPKHQSYLQTSFASRDDLFRAVRYSCMFPFYTADSPWLMDTSVSSTRQLLPRLMMDGLFSVPWDRFGCPLLEDMSTDVDRTIAVSVLPQHVLKWCANGMGSFPKHNCISPSLAGQEANNDYWMINLIRMAVFPSSRQELTRLFDSGGRDAEMWCRQEERRHRQKEKRKRQRRRILRMETANAEKRVGV
ncbi:patatin-like phospholipase [Nitzschia inconspicua]|uniref:Patatin-like phospholipase n=1 Tax=Nitzschia inconspicua TaxID=303405 RepID=A0A9K3L5T1_9STRA|nr:patatin-like phospholipase [Nitzschia inconspicua]